MRRENLRIKAILSKEVDCIQLIELIRKISWERNVRNSGRLAIAKGTNFFFSSHKKEY